MTSVTRTLTDRVTKLKFSDLDDQTLHRAKYHILDSIGAILAGSQQEVTKIVERSLKRAGCSGNTPVIGRRNRADMFSVALISGTAGHGLELDDGYRAGSVHPGTVIIPAALAAGYRLNRSGMELIKSIIAGYEVMCRLAAACHPQSRWRGFHNTSTTGVFGAATVWGSLKKFDSDLLEHAFGIAASTASGLFTFLYGGDVKRFHPGMAAKNGLISGLLAEEGLKGPPSALETKEGFFYAYASGDTGNFDYDSLDILTVGGGSPWAINDCYIKPYACCRHIHSIIDAIFQIMDDTGLSYEQIKIVRVGSYKVAVAHDISHWDSFTGAQMSIPFVAATALRNHSIKLEHFTKKYRTDQITMALSTKIKVSIDADCEVNYPRLRSAIVAIETLDGQTIERRVDEPFGSPANRLNDSALTAKFTLLAEPIIGTMQAKEIAEKIWNLDRHAKVRPIINSLSPD
jgi:2-methylcitrate dehydratase PrpD